MKIGNAWVRIACSLLIFGTLTSGAVLARTRRPVHGALVIGWHDEMNDIPTWQPLGGANEPDVFAERPGAMTLRLPHVPDGFPYTYQWGGVTQRASVDLGRYPVIVACVSKIQDGSYAHMDLEERDATSHPVRTMRSPTLLSPGLSVLDVGEPWGTDTRRIQLRLIVGGKLTGASCEYAWVRFVRREDVPKLQAKWNRDQPVKLEP